MTRNDADLERLVVARIRRMNALLLAIVVGLLAGFALFILTNWLVIKGGQVVGPHLALLGQFFFGYRVSFAGSLIGFAYAFVTGAVLAYAGARLYNGVADLRERRRR